MLLDMAAEGLGERVAVGPRESGMTFSELRRLAAGETPNGGESGVVALLAPNGPEVPLTLFSAAWSGLSYAPINYRLPRETIGELLERLAPGTVVCTEEELSWVGRKGAIGCRAWLEARARMAGEARGYPAAPTRPAVLLFTSGTSAAPKTAALDHENLLSYVLNTVEFASADDDEAVLLAVPPFHIAGVAGVISACYAGRRIVPLPAFSAEEWLVTAKRERVTHAFLVPTMLSRIVAAMEADPEARVPTLRTLSYGGARMPLPVLERALRLFPDTGFVNAYGLTETSSTVSVLGPDDHRKAFESDDEAARARLGSAGRPLPGVEVCVTDETGKVCAPGEPGEIRIRGPQVSGDYVDQPSRLGTDGWLSTGDVGWIDEEGYLYVTGRSDDLIISGGENISPAEVEDALLHHPAVASAAAVGVPDGDWGERVAAVVVLRAGTEADPGDIAAWATERLGRLKAPEPLVVRPELPMTATGKVLRRQIRAELLEELRAP